MRKFLSTTAGKVALSAGILGVGGAMAGLGTFATFTSTTSASQTVASGTVVIALGTPNSAQNRLTVNASGLVPTDTVQRAFDISNGGSQGLASIGLTTSASPSSLLDTDVTNGLHMAVNECSVPWTEAGVSPAYTYTCSGTTTPIIASQPVIGANINMPGLLALAPAGVDHLHLTLTLPTTADNTFEAKSSTISYLFLGTQRNATSQ